VIGAHLAGLSESEIARRSGRTRGTIHAVVTGPEAQKARELAKSILAQNAVGFAEDWLHASKVAAEKGNHTPALDALERLGAVASPKTDRATGPQFSVKIGIALPGLGETATLGLPAGLAVVEAETTAAE
jgi:hypothetical protein